MGGYFSTRWGAEHVRQDTDPLLKLDVRWLHRIGALRPGAIATPAWTRARDGAPSGSIVTIRDRDRPVLTFDYRTRRPGEGWQPVRETVWLDTTACNYGGDRPWFLCPGCQSRRAVLFSVGVRFRCRVCHDLAYTSTREDPTERAIRRCAELRSRIGGGFGQPVWTIPPKPDSMTWRRYSRIVDQLLVEINRASGLLDDRLSRMTSEIDRLLAQRKAMR
jgi:hypothetical protein